LERSTAYHGDAISFWLIVVSLSHEPDSRHLSASPPALVLPGTACFAAARLGAASFGVWPTFDRTGDFVLDLRELSSAAATIGRFFTSATTACSSLRPRTWGTARSPDSLMWLDPVEFGTTPVIICGKFYAN
jgi:hypothetical protein